MSRRAIAAENATATAATAAAGAGGGTSSSSSLLLPQRLPYVPARPRVDPIDAADVSDTLACVEYVGDIMESLYESEVRREREERELIFF